MAHSAQFEPSRLPVSIWTGAFSCCISAPSSGSLQLSDTVFILSARLPWLRTRRAAKGEITLVQIFVRDNNVDQALKALKKKMQREGSFREMKRHVHFEKPSEKRARQKAEAVRRARKLARKRAQREGLLPAPKPRGR